MNAFVRSKTWISPSFGQTLLDSYGVKGPISDELRNRLISDPEYYQKFRLSIEEDGNGIHAVTMLGTPLQSGAKEVFYEHMKKRLETKPEIFEALIPSFSPGCRRLTPGPGYLEALTQKNVEFITSPITRLSENAIHTSDGNSYEIDALVCATGFKAMAPPPFSANGLSLSDKWKDRPTNYLSHSVAGFPNTFLMLGPNSGVGSGSLTKMIETVGDYIIKCVRKIQKENIAAMVVKEAREKDFAEYADEYFKGTVFGEECRSWYKQSGSGAVVGLWPGSTLHLMEAMRSPRWEDFDYTYVEELEGREDGAQTNGLGGKKRANQLAWLGNGWTAHQMEEKHLAWYLYPEFMEKPLAPRPEENEFFNIRPFSH